MPKKEHVDREIKGFISIHLDPKVLLSVRRALFPKGVSVNLLLAYFLERLAVNDERLLEFIDEAKQHEIQKAKEKNDLKALDAEALYALIAKGEEDEFNE